MSRRVANFVSIPAVPQSGLSQIELATLSAIKENVELLTGARGGGRRQAITKEQTDINLAPTQEMRQVSAIGRAVSINGTTVPTAEDYVKLVQDVQELANDVANLRDTLNTLLSRLKV
jgi:flagellar hook assembly protein FlgD